ncbi:MAG: ABA4-like family protein [Saprospiraceae bacterium]|nr:ABA4-like family protein [Saprospiraceae bacterium]MDW8483108.1 DUF4281 domain-containing protein [Saprospiraceae bacterium]
MTVSQFYAYASILIFVPWALLIAAPRWRYTEILAFLTALGLSLAAAFFTYEFLTDEARQGNLLSFEGMKNLFRHPAMLLTGWFNYLSFSLLVGIWLVSDARSNRLPHWLVVPVLVLTLLGGPVGALVYLGLRSFKTGKWRI